MPDITLHQHSIRVVGGEDRERRQTKTKVVRFEVKVVLLSLDGVVTTLAQRRIQLALVLKQAFPEAVDEGAEGSRGRSLLDLGGLTLGVPLCEDQVEDQASATE